MKSDVPALAIIANSITPYRLHLHRRIVREVPQIRLLSVFTHEASNSPWTLEADAEISPAMFGSGDPSEGQARLQNALREWRKGGRITRWLGEHDVRAVIVGGYNDPGRLRIIRWCRRAGIPVFLWGDSNIHGDTVLGIRAAAKRLALGHVIGWCDGVMPCGSLGARYFQKYGAAADRIFLMPYEPDYELVRRIDAAAIARVCRRFGLDRSRRRIVYSGRLVGIKRVDLLLDAFSRIAADRPGWDLLVIGGGELMAQLRARVPERQGGDRITWAGFIDDQATVSALYRASDLLVLPSDREPWALVINEAAAAGLAIVASDVVGSAAELVRDGVNGRVFRRGDLEALVQCLAEVTSSPHRVDGMKAASEQVLEDWRRCADPVAGLRRALLFVNVIGPS